MQLNVGSKLYYQVHGPATFLVSLRCLEHKSQEIISETLRTNPETVQTDLTIGSAHNRFTKFNVEEPGELIVEYDALARTSVELVDIRQIPDVGVEALGQNELAYLFPSRYVPSDLLRNAAADLFGHIENSFAIAVAVEEWLYQHITYEFGSSTEQSWALDTFVSRAGVCRDFSHLGIAFCRALNIPARYVTVYAHQLEPQDFHAVFEVFVGGKWYVMDGNRRVPLNGMVRIATGRDASDVSMATLFGNVVGTGIEVTTRIEEDGSAPFVPVTRQSLLESGKALHID